MRTYNNVKTRMTTATEIILMEIKAQEGTKVYKSIQPLKTSIYFNRIFNLYT